MKSYAIFDIETLVTDNEAHKRYQLMERYDPASCSLNYSRRGQRFENDPLKSPRWPFQSVVAASIMICTEIAEGNISPISFHTFTVRDHDEKDIVKSLLAILACSPEGTELVSWGGAWSDIPHLVAAAMRHGLTLPHGWGWLAWGGQGRVPHIDLSRLLTGGAKMKQIHMSEYAAAQNIPAKFCAPAWKVADLYRQGEYEKVGAMCDADVITTTLLLARWRQLMDGRANVFTVEDRIIRELETRRSDASYLPTLRAHRNALFRQQCEFAEMAMPALAPQFLDDEEMKAA